MSNTRIGTCSSCGKETLIQNKFKNLCKDCVYKRNHNGKSQGEVLSTKKISNAYKLKKTGEKAMFLEIWYEKEHVCENCKLYLGEVPKAYMFAHIIPKSVMKEGRLDKSNISLLCWDCHDALDKQGKESYERRRN